MSCTKGDLILPWCRYVWFVLGINSQLVEIDSNRRLSRTVRNLASTNCVMEYDGSDEHGIIIPAIVTTILY